MSLVFMELNKYSFYVPNVYHTSFTRTLAFAVCTALAATRNWCSGWVFGERVKESLPDTLSWLKVTSRDCPLSAQWLACCWQLIVLTGHLCQPYRSLAHSAEQSPKSPMHNVTHIWDQDTHSQCNCDSNYPYSTVNSHKWWEHHISGVRIVVGMAHTISLRQRRPPTNASLSRLLSNQRYSLTVALMFAQNIMTLGVLTPFEPCRPKIKIHIRWSSGLHQDICLACENKIECFMYFSINNWCVCIHTFYFV